MRILLCDDHPIVIMSTKLLLEAHGHRVVCTVDEPAALGPSVARHQPDLCIVDLRYGSDDPGPALAAIADVTQRTSVSVLVLSGSLDAGGRRAALAAGACAAVSKSIPSGDLVALVEGRHRSTAATETSVPQRSNPYGLTARELQVLDGLVEGLPTPGIAVRLGVRPATARCHVQHLMMKMGVRSRSAAVARGIAEGVAGGFAAAS
jgi:two-component system nitrate/nitrite response regulator NarL